MSETTGNTLEAKLNDLLKESMRSKDARTADAVRMLKTKHMERRTAAGFKGPLDDALWLDVIATYQKQLKKSREEYEKAGDKGKEAIEQIDFEIALCARFLPALASEAETRAIVDEAVARLGVTDPKQAGKVVGDILKAHKGKVDSDLVRKLLAEKLGG